VRPRVGLAAATFAGAFVILASPSALAARGLETGFAEGAYQSADAAARDAAFEQTVGAGAGIIRVNVLWSAVTSGHPANPRDPADPAYDFSGVDNAVKGAAGRGLDVMITVYSAPAYAEGPNRPASAPPGTWKPDPGALADFATAVATRYSGSFLGLPRVRYFQAWNEPNLSVYLTPQYEGGAASSPGHYRQMLNAFFAAVKAVHSDNQVVTAGTAPYGDPPGGDRVRPLVFWRDVLCLRGRKLEDAKCPTKASFDILAHHPINTSGGPRRSAVNPDDASTPDFVNVARTLRAAERQKNVGTKGSHPLWATELWWDSDPPDTAEGVPIQKHARYLEEALYILWKQGADVVINLQLRDSPVGGSARADASGVLFADGSQKPAFTAFRFPFVTDRRSKSKLIAWCKSPQAGKLAIQRKRGNGWTTEATVNVRAGEVLEKTLRLRGSQKLRAVVSGEQSLVWTQR
jgi:hypothetical protein